MPALLLVAWTPPIMRIEVQETNNGSFFGTLLVPRWKLDRKSKTDATVMRKMYLPYDANTRGQFSFAER
jgi:hypothetical protein